MLVPSYGWECPFYVIGGIDAFSKFMVARLTTNKSAGTCRDFIREEICHRFGYPKHISTDRGSEFNDKEMAFILALHDVNRIERLDIHQRQMER